MSTRTRSLKLFTGLLIATTLVAACGDSAQPTPTSVPTSVPATIAVPTEAPTPGAPPADATAGPSTGNVLAPATDAPTAQANSAQQSPLPPPTADASTQTQAPAAQGAVTATAETTATTVTTGPLSPSAAAATANLGAPTAGTFEQDNTTCQTLIGEDVADAVEGYLRCGYFVVPELHSAPDGKKIKLPVVVVKSSSASPASDPLLILQGGPGGSAIREYFSNVINASFRPAQDRDVILVDQRGSYLAQPALSCPEYREVVIKRIQAGGSITTTAQERLAANQACRTRLTDEGVNLTAYNSFENAADVAALPGALGYGSYNLYGFSYGSLLAQHVLARHPQGIRSVILDGVMPRAGKFLLNRNANFQTALQKVAAACDADPICKQEYPNITERFLQLIAALDAAPEPMKIETDLQGQPVSMDAPLTGNRLLNTMYYMLYDSLTISRLPRLVDLVEKKDYDYLGRLRNQYELATLDLTTFGMSNSILCAEDAVFTEAEAIQADGATEAGLNVFRTADELLQTCAIWNVPALDASAHQPAQSEAPVLVLNGELDPVTPPEAGQDAVIALTNVISVTFRGMGHGQLNSLNACAAGIAGNFLNAPTAQADTSCAADMPAIEFSTTSLQTTDFTDVSAGVGSVRPVGWIQIAPGQFVDDVTIAAIGFQSNANPDPTAIQRTLEQAQAGRIGTRENNGIAWTIYEGRTNDLFVNYAVSKDGTYIVDLISASDAQREALYNGVLLPALDAFIPIKAAAQTIVLGAPAANAEVTSPVQVSGVAATTPFENNLVYRVYNGSNLIIAEGPINVKGELGGPGTFVASLPFTVTQRESGRIEVVDIDAATGDPFATAAVSVTLTPLNVETQRVPVTITVDAPQPNAAVTSPVVVKGSISLTPFENNLVYRLIDASGKEVGIGPITTAGELGKPATFETSLAFTPTVSGPGRLFIESPNESGGSPFATAAIDVQLTAPGAPAAPDATAVTATEATTGTSAITPTEAVTATEAMTSTSPITPTEPTPATSEVTATGATTGTIEIAPGATVTAVVEVTPAPAAAPAATGETTPTASATTTLPAATVIDLSAISLNPAGIARRVNKTIKAAVPNNESEPPLLNGLPTRVQYTFDRDRLSPYFSPRERQLLIMPVEEYRALLSGPENERSAALFDTLLGTLREILATKPASVTGEIPLFPPLGASQVFAAQIKYLDFDGGSCVRFVTAYAQDASPVTDDKLFYTCQGLTSDGKFLVSFVHPLRSVVTPATFRQVPRSVLAELEKDPQGYFDGLIADLNKLSARGFRPYLNRADAVMQSLTIEQRVTHRPTEQR